MELGVIILLLVGVVALLAHNRGKLYEQKERLEDDVEATKDRNDIRALDDDELDDELRKYWD